MLLKCWLIMLNVDDKKCPVTNLVWMVRSNSICRIVVFCCVLAKVSILRLTVFLLVFKITTSFDTLKSFPTSIFDKSCQPPAAFLLIFTQISWPPEYFFVWISQHAIHTFLDAKDRPIWSDLSHSLSLSLSLSLCLYVCVREWCVLVCVHQLKQRME